LVSTLDNLKKYVMLNNSEVKKDLMERVDAALDVVLKAGYGRIKVKIDTEREEYRVSYKANI